jgi:hypothetical protein
MEKLLNIEHFFTENLLVGKYPWIGNICALNFHLLEGTIGWVTNSHMGQQQKLHYYT